MKYLLVMFDKGEDSNERWGTYGTPVKFYEEEYELDNEAALIESIAEFMEDRPNGDVSIHIIEEIEWDTDKYDYLLNLKKLGELKSKEIAKKKKEAEKQRQLKIREKELEYDKARDLEQLAKLKAKYES